MSIRAQSRWHVRVCLLACTLCTPIIYNNHCVLESTSYNKMIADFQWTCANYVYTYVDSFSLSAYHEFKKIAPEKNIQMTTVSVGLPNQPTAEDYDEAVTKIMESSCLATVIVTQTTPTASIIYEARKQGYKGHFVVQGASMSIQTNIRRMAGDTQMNEILHGMHAVAPFHGVGTKRSAFMNLDMSMSGVRMRSTSPISITTADIKPWRVIGGIKHPRQRWTTKALILNATTRLTPLGITYTGRMESATGNVGEWILKRQGTTTGKANVSRAPNPARILSYRRAYAYFIPILHVHLVYAFKVPTCFHSDTCRS